MAIGVKGLVTMNL